MNGKEKFMKAMNIGICKRCIMKCKRQSDELDHKYLGGRWPTVTDATDPSLILWKNLGYGVIDRCMLSCYVVFVSLLLSIGGFTVVVLLILYKNQHVQANSMECGNQLFT